MLIDLNNKVAVVTGAARGIGAALADRLAAEGVTVSRWDINWPAGGNTTDRLTVDVTKSDTIKAALDAVMAQYGRVDILLNNAGITKDLPADLMTEDEFTRIIDVNLNGVYRVARAVIPIMKAQKSGRIINTASFAAIVPAFGGVAYGASKAGVVWLTRVLAGELGPWNITVNAFAPGMVPTDINHYTERPQSEQDSLLSTLTLRRWETTDDVADLVCFLASEQAGYITGTLVDVSGGKLAIQRPNQAYEWAAHQA
ncbi:MAG: SDR family oxidoreductase [Propionibacteriaceae bacterium]|nr:SDR family oxidoreductase [Propionibacteriaceae bacterium]